MPKGHKSISPSPAGQMPSPFEDSREAIHWFIDNYGLYQGTVRGVFATDCGDEQEAVLEAAVINLKSRNIEPLVLTGETIYKQADYLWRTALEHTAFGRPVASKIELDISGSDLVILKDLDAPELAHHLWYLFHQIIYPRALFNKPTLVTSALSYEEFITYGAGCDDLEFAGRKVTWEKLLWTLDATTIDLQHFLMVRNEGLPPMLKPEYYLYRALKERGLDVHPQHILGDYKLGFALYDKERKLDVEFDVFASIDPNKPSALEVKRNLVLLSDGWRILRFTTAEILSNLVACVDAVEEVWLQGRKKSASGRLLSGTQPTAVPELPVDDDMQRLAITQGAGPAAVAGGAGTGKSSCITHRVAHLIAQGVNPEKILVLSYSADCAKTLKVALEASIDRQQVQRVHVYCWHDLGFKLLKENLTAIKRKPPLKLESNPQKVLQRLMLKYKKDMDPTMLELSEELDEYTLATLVSLYKANLVTPKHLKERAKTDVDDLVAKVFQGYEEQLQKANRIDRDDMVCLAAQLLVDQPDIRARYQYQYDFVLVDEYQDATAASDLLARLLAFPQDNVYLVGDEDESIHESRGSLPRLMSEVSIRLPNARCYVLEKNWRNHPTIVEHARQFLLGLTRRRIQKDMVSGWGAAPTSAVIGPHKAASEGAECEWVAEEISILVDSGRLLSEIAILVRESKYSMLLEESLSRHGIRCLTASPQSALVPDEVGDVMAFLNLVMDPDGPKARESFERICQLRVKEVDPKLSATIASFAESNNLSYLKGIEIYWQAVQDPSCRELEQLVRIIRTMHQEKLPPAETISLLKRTQRLNEYYKQIKVPPGANYEPLRKLGQLEEEARKFQNVGEFVKSYTANQQALTGGDGAEQSVQIINVPEAKGCDFPVVFIVGVAEGLFPSAAAGDLEEERRQFYVGITRAKELLYLSYPSTFGNLACLPSPFLFEGRFMLPEVKPEPPSPIVVANVKTQPPAQSAIKPGNPTPLQPGVKAVNTQPPQVAKAPVVVQSTANPAAQVLQPGSRGMNSQQPEPGSVAARPASQQQGAAPAGGMPQQPHVLAPAGSMPQQPQQPQGGVNARGSLPQQQAAFSPSGPITQQQGAIAGNGGPAQGMNNKQSGEGSDQTISNRSIPVYESNQRPPEPAPLVVQPVAPTEDFYGAPPVNERKQLPTLGGPNTPDSYPTQPSPRNKSKVDSPAAELTASLADGIINNSFDATVIASQTSPDDENEDESASRGRIKKGKKRSDETAGSPSAEEMPFAPGASSANSLSAFGASVVQSLPPLSPQQPTQAAQAARPSFMDEMFGGPPTQQLPTVQSADIKAADEPTQPEQEVASTRFIPAEPRSYFEPAADEAPTPLAPLEATDILDLIQSEPIGLPPSRAKQKSRAVDQEYSPSAPIEQPIADADSDIADLLELAAKAPKKKGRGKFAAKNVLEENESEANDFDADRAEPQRQPEPNYQPQPQQYQPQLPLGNMHAQGNQQEAPGQAQYAEPAAEYHPEKMHHPMCQDCGAHLEPGSRFCGECGGRLMEQIPACHRCGIALEPSANFCGECGAKQPINAAQIGITEAQLTSVPKEALSNSESFKRWMEATNPNKRQNWMVKLLKYLEI